MFINYAGRIPSITVLKWFVNDVLIFIFLYKKNWKEYCKLWRTKCGNQGYLNNSTFGRNYYLVGLPLKGFCHQMNIFLKAYKIKSVLSLHSLMFFFNF